MEEQDPHNASPESDLQTSQPDQPIQPVEPVAPETPEPEPEVPAAPSETPADSNLITEQPDEPIEAVPAAPVVSDPLHDPFPGRTEPPARPSSQEVEDQRQAELAAERAEHNERTGDDAAR